MTPSRSVSSAPGRAVLGRERDADREPEQREHEHGDRSEDPGEGFRHERSGGFRRPRVSVPAAPEPLDAAAVSVAVCPDPDRASSAAAVSPNTPHVSGSSKNPA